MAVGHRGALPRTVTMTTAEARPDSFLTTSERLEPDPEECELRMDFEISVRPGLERLAQEPALFEPMFHRYATWYTHLARSGLQDRFHEEIARAESALLGRGHRANGEVR